MPRGPKLPLQRSCTYYGDDSARHEGESIERNGNLTLIRDAATGVERWLAPHEIDQEN